MNHYTQPESPPETRAVPYSRLIETLCEGRDCNAIAYYDDKQATIFYDDRLGLENNIGAQGFIVHEMVHYLQHQAGLMTGKSMACEQRMQLEREAYVVQQQFLRQHQLMTYQVDMAIRLLGNMCRDRGRQ